MYYLSEVLLIKNENQYLLEHLQSNVQAGIEHFYIYDNLSNIPVEMFLQKNAPELLNKCTVNIFQDTKSKQIDCYNQFLKDYRHETKWAAFVDTDEVFEGELKTLCKNSENDYALIYFNGVTHGSNGLAFKNDKTMKENFYKDVIKQWSYRKSVVQTEFVQTQLPHTTFLNTKDLKTLKNPKEVTLHHYYYKSFEEFVLKIKRGVIQPSTVRHLWSFFLYNQINEKEKNDIMKKYNVDLNFKTEKNEK